MVTDEQKSIRKGLGEVIRAARKKARLTQLEVATVTRMDVNYYARIERGVANPSYEKLHGVMKALGMDSLSIK